ncbi:MAG: HAD-IG family 5'-nucleotidase [Planctomycetota bacterium]|nr:HAD-IG family 5'-nucleotidase [Planctomycetota bacterium]
MSDSKWFEVISTAIRNPSLDHQRSVFTNRTLRFDYIQAVGFDFDHTLAVYNSKALDDLAEQMVARKLVEEEGIPEQWFEEVPDPSFARKGLILDLDEGVILKTDRYGHVLRAFHGRKKLTVGEKRKLYGDRDVIPHSPGDDRFIQVDHAFSRPEILLWTGLVGHTEAGERRRLWERIRHHTDTIHRDGSLKDVITANPSDFIVPDPRTEALLTHLRDIGKKVFLLTNSEWEYTASMMGTVLGRGDEADDSWLQLFDLVVVEANKPSYFSASNKMAAEPGPKSGVLRGGNLAEMEQAIGVSGPEVLYVGDHIYSDLISSKKNVYWRTMLVVPELQEELSIQETLPGIVRQLKEVDERRISMEREVMHWKAMEHALKEIKTDVSEERRELKKLRTECAIARKQATDTLKDFIRQRESLRSRLSTATNSQWGSLFRAGSELTYYGRQLEDFACTYTSRATNLMFYPPNHYFRSPMDYLPHELESM